MQNHDYIAAKTSQTILDQCISDENGKTNASEVENLITKALGVLQEDGVYAVILYLQSRKERNTTFTVKSILNWKGFVSSLKKRNKSKEIEHIYDFLDEKRRNIINRYEENNEPSDDVKKSLIDGLNELLKNEEFYNKEVFRKEVFDNNHKLSKEELDKLHKKDNEKLNRLLIDAIFKDIITKHRNDIAKTVSERLIEQTNTVGINDTNNNAFNSSQKICKYVSDSICNNLNHIFLIKELWEKTLIYCRYGAKAYDKDS